MKLIVRTLKVLLLFLLASCSSSPQAGWVQKSCGGGYISSAYALEHIIPTVRHSFEEAGIMMEVLSLNEKEALIRISAKSMSGTIRFTRINSIGFWDGIGPDGKMTGGTFDNPSYNIQKEIYFYDNADKDIYDKYIEMALKKALRDGTIL